MRKQWDEWGWGVLTVIACAAFILAMYWSDTFFTRAGWCYGPEDKCLRNWVSALGGWAAVAAAVPTVLFLAKQVRDSDRHHRQTLAISSRPTIALAYRTQVVSLDLEYKADEIHSMLLSGSLEHFTRHDLAAGFVELQSFLSSDVFRRFEEEVYDGDFSGFQLVLDSVTKTFLDMSNLDNRYTSDTSLEMVDQWYLRRYRYVAQEAKTYALGIRAQAVTLVRELQALTE